jgi:tetratricopeptide (TPR) repeat protein
LGLLACSSPEQRAEQARADFAQALERGDLPAAHAAIGKLEGNLPTGADSLLELADLLVRGGDAPGAGWLLEEGVRRHPERDDLRVALSRVALLLGNPSLARRVAAEIEPGSSHHPSALVLQAQAELQLGSLEDALATLQEAERGYPERVEARLVRIATLLSERRMEEAREAIDATLAGELPDARVRSSLLVTLAQIESREGASDDAVARLEDLLRGHPEDVLAWRALAQVIGERDGPDAATDRLEQALAREDVPPELYGILAQLHAHAGRPAEAEAALRAWVSRAATPSATLPLARFLADEGRMRDATNELDAALARDPEEPALLLLLAETLLAAERIDDAREAIRRFRAASYADDPQSAYLDARLMLAEGHAARAAEQLRDLAPRLDRAETQFWLGRALETLGDLDGARRRYALAQLRDPRWPAPAVAQARIAQRRGDWADLAHQGRVLVRLAPQRAEGWSALVEAALHAGDGPASEPLARQARERFPGDPHFEILLVQALRGQGRFDEALAALAEAQGASPSAELSTERARTLGMAGRIDDGLAEIEHALAAYGETAGLRAAQASLQFAGGDAASGAEATERALHLDPEDPAPLRLRCRFRAATGDFAGARSDCERYLRIRSDDAEAHFLLGVALDALGEVDAAIAEQRRAAALDPKDARSRNNLAELLAARGDLEGALAAAQEAYRLDESNPHVLDTLGHLYTRKGHATRAVPLLERAHAGLPEVAEVRLHLAVAYRDADRNEDARRLLLALREDASVAGALRVRAAEALDTLP